MIARGDIVEIKEKNRLICGVVLSCDAKELRVLTPDKRDFKILPEKVFFFNAGLDVNQERERLALNLQDIHKKRETLKGEIQLKLLWEIVGESSDAKSVLDLAKLYFGEGINDDKIAAMLRALYADLGYFKPRGNGFFPVDKESVETLERGRSQQEAYKNWEEKFILWLQNHGEGPPPLGSEKAFEILKEFLIFGEKSPKFHAAEILLKKAKLADWDLLFKVLTRNGILKEDENLLLERYRIPLEFSPKLESQAQELSLGKSFSGNRLDLTRLYTVTIDDEFTTDIDDAISIEVLPEGWRIGIHIADAAEFVPKDSDLDKEAHTRSISIYLPDRKITMFPESLTQAASLKMSKISSALSILALFHANGQLVSWELKETLIQVKEKLTYDSVDSCLDPQLLKLYELAKNLRDERIKAGALVIHLPRAEVRVDKAANKISLVRAKLNSPSQILVSEWMIFANRLVAKLCYQSKIPVIFRTQEVPSKIFSFDEKDLVMLFKQRRFLKKGEASIQPKPHHGLGLPVYLQMTSPIRRYSDLIIHRQLKSFLRKEPLPYSSENLEAIMAYSEPWTDIADQVERETRRYWLYKFLQPQVGSKFQAVILESTLNDYLLFIPEFALEVHCPKSIHPFAEGDSVEVVLEAVKPRLNFIKVVLP